jgi:predicted TIM-barrel fold metal-dependent hydrolase
MAGRSRLVDAGFASTLRPWLEDARRRFAGVTPLDVHTHVGMNDPAGVRATWEDLLGALDEAQARAATFPLHEPDGYPSANRAVIERAAATGGRVVALARLDPADDPLAEARRSLGAGAAGFKLHPRAERFSLDDARLDGVFALADERSLPILVHAGTGVPGLGRHALERAERYRGTRLILAHCALADLAWLWREAPAHRNVFFDTSWWQPSELVALFRLIPPGQILFASDLPYSPPALGLVRTVRCAVQAGLSDAQIAAVVGQQAERLLTGAEALDVGDRRDEREAVGPLLERLFVNLSIAAEALHEGAAPGPALEVARHACAVPPEVPSAGIAQAVGRVLDDYERVAAGAGAGAAANPYAPGFHIVQLAAFVARTPAAGVPDTL